MIAIIILYALIAITFPLAQYTLYFASPTLVLTVRMLIAGSGLLIYYILRNKTRIIIPRSDWLLFGQAILFHMYLAFVLEFWSLQYLSSLKTNILYCTTPFLAALFEYMMHQKRLTAGNITGMLCATASLIPLVLQSSCDSSAPLGDLCYFGYLPEIALMIAIIAATYAWFVIKKLLARGYHFLVINGVAMIGGGILCGITGIATDTLTVRSEVLWPFYAALASLIIISNVIVYNLYSILIERYRITLISLAGFLSPIFGTFYAWLFFKEPLTWYYGLAIVGIAAGLWIFYRDEY